MAGEFLTIGYEGAALDDVAATLDRAGVATLIDVREVPWSRRPEFAKRALSTALAERGIAYRHLKGLGNPKPGRDAARAGDLDTYRAIFTAHLDGPEALADLTEAAALANAGRVCLMCYEADPAHCHRLLVAERIEQATGLTARHLRMA